MVRTHKPLGRWPRLSRRQGWRIGVAMVGLTLLWMVAGPLGFVEWQASEARGVAQIVRDSCERLSQSGPAACAAEWAEAQARIEAQRPDYWREAIEVALLVAIVFWILVAGFITIAHWIVTGDKPNG